MAAISVPMCRATSNAFSMRLVVEVVPAEQPRHEQQVAARRDRQELRQSLHEAEDDGVQDRHRAVDAPSGVRERPPDASLRRSQAPLIVTSRMTRLTPAAPHRQPVDVAADLDDVEQHPLQRRGDRELAHRRAELRRRVISIPDAPVEKSPLIGLTPECSPDDHCDEQAVVDVGDELGLVAGAGLQLQREAADAGRAGEATADGVAGRHRAGPARRVAGVDELAQHAAVDEHVAPGRETLAVDVGRRVGQRVGRVVDERDDVGGDLLAEAVAEQAAPLDDALAVQRRADDRRGTGP